MRAKIVIVGLVAGLGATLAPLSPASAYCEPDPTVVASSKDCSNSCTETGARYEALRAKVGVAAVPRYWDIFICPQGR